MIAYLCDGRVDVVETINGANILTFNRTEKMIKSRDSLGRDKKHSFIIWMQNIVRYTSKKEIRKKILANLVDHRFVLFDYHLHG